MCICEFQGSPKQVGENLERQFKRPPKESIVGCKVGVIELRVILASSGNQYKLSFSGPCLPSDPSLEIVMQLKRTSSRASNSCIRSMASSTSSQTSLPTVNIARYGPRVVNHDVFTCEGAVDAHRLLSLVRKDICQLARRHGWNALTEEQ